MEKELHTQKIKSRLMAANISASKASVYYTPPDDDLLHGSHLHLQTTPIHINYIDENLDHQKLELQDFKIDPQLLLFNTSRLYVNPEGASSSQAAAAAAAAMTAGSSLACSIEDNNLDIQLLADNGSPMEMNELKDSNDVKNSKSCPAIYKVSKQRDGSTLHELLTSDGDGAPQHMLRFNPVDESSLTTIQLSKEKLNIVLEDCDKALLHHHYEQQLEADSGTDQSTSGSNSDSASSCQTHYQPANTTISEKIRIF